MRFANGTALLNHYFIKLAFLDVWKQLVLGTEAETFASLAGRWMIWLERPDRCH